MDTVRINEKDNVCVNLETGHKIAVCDIAKGADIIKYGYPIGYSTEDIKEGESVHSHNMKTKLGDILSYEYTPNFEELTPEEPFTINAYIRENGEIGIRNDIWIVPTAGCVNSIAKQLAENGQILTQYVDLAGNATSDIAFNPNDSMYAICFSNFSGTYKSSWLSQENHSPLICEMP